MPPFVLRPRTQQRTLWLAEWGAITLIVLLPLIWPLFASRRLEVAQMLEAMIVLWLLITLPIGVWILLYYRSLAAEITENEVVLRKGVITRKTVSVPIDQIVTVDASSGLLERLFGLQRIRVFTAENRGGWIGRPALTLYGVGKTDALGDRLLKGGPDFEGVLQAARTGGVGGDRALFDQILKEIRELRREIKSTRSGS